MSQVAASESRRVNVTKPLLMHLICLCIGGMPLVLQEGHTEVPPWLLCREHKYLVDQHGGHAPTEGNRTASRSYIAPAAQSYRRTAQVLAGTPADKAHIVARMEVFSRPGGPALEALEEVWIDQLLCKGLVTVHNDITQAMRSSSRKRDAKELLQLWECSKYSKADIYLHRSFLRALPLWLDQRGADNPLYKQVQPIREHPGW